MSFLDYAIVALIGLAALYGIARGVLRMAASLLALVVGIFLAQLYHAGVTSRLESWFALGPGAASIAGYALVFALAAVAVAVAGRLLFRFSRAVGLGWADRLCGMVLAGAAAAWLAGIGLGGIALVLGPDYPVIRESKLAGPLEAYNRRLLSFVPAPVKATVESRGGAMADYLSRQKPFPAGSAEPGRQGSPEKRRPSGG